MQGIVPLYYNMRKAAPQILNNETIYNGLNFAFKGSGIGLYSNNISKIWNSDVFATGTEEEKQHAINCIKRLCCQNNFVIDYAKTLYKPEFPDDIKRDIQQFTKNAVPHFFKFAKDKEEHQVAKINGCFVNKLSNRVKNTRLNFRALELDKFDYTMLMNNRELEIRYIKTHPIVIEYNQIMKDEFYAKYYHQMLNRCRQLEIYKDLAYKSKNKQDFIVEQVRSEIIKRLMKLGYCKEFVVDVLVMYLYDTITTKNKATLWFCFGEEILVNLRNNINSTENCKKTIQCIDCGEWFEVPMKSTTVCRCPECQKIKKNNDSKLRMQNMRKRAKND